MMKENMNKWSNNLETIDSIINDILKKENTEDELLNGLRQHDGQAYQFLYDNYSKAIFSIIKQIIPQQEVAEDLLQEVFVKVWQNIQTYEETEGNLYTWMTNIARNISIERTRSKEFNKQNKTVSVKNNVQIWGNTEESKIYDIGLKKVLTSLPADNTKLIDLAYFKGFTQEEISKILMIPVGTVKTRMLSAINFLRSRVATLSNHDNIVMPSLSDKRENFLTPIEKMNIVRIGISKESLDQLQSKTTLDYDQLSKVLGIKKSSLMNKKTAEKFDTSLSERILALADLYSYGYEVFEAKEEFNKWIFTSNKALGGQTPYDIMDNQFGREEIRNLIGRIDYGVYS